MKNLVKIILIKIVVHVFSEHTPPIGKFSEKNKRVGQCLIVINDLI